MQPCSKETKGVSYFKKNYENYLKTLCDYVLKKQKIEIIKKSTELEGKYSIVIGK